jgi:UDP-N-acetylmuramoyl-tripeptide--D-alanyl-D-alanine ligase
VIPLSLEEIAGIVGGRVVDAGTTEPVVTGPAFLDSRAPEPGGLFVAFEGEHVDGHDYAPGAVEGGGAAVLGTRATGVPTVLVGDAQAALQELARQVLRRLREAGDGPKVLAVTGSQGKTTVKDMLARVLADAGSTVATAGSFNNELGLPLTVLRADERTSYLLLEMGARGVGHLAELCAIAPPDISLVLNVGKAHIGEFGSREQIAVAKGELVEALRPAGAAVLNRDDPLVAAMATRTDAHAYTFGRSADAGVRVDDVEVDDLGRASFMLVHGDDSVPVSLRLLGEHQALNAAATAATALAAGLELADIATSLGAVERLSPWRMELTELEDGLVVVNDAYNANPDSMRAALETLERMGRGPRDGLSRRTVAVLGEMRELGADAEEEHREVGRLADRLGIDVVVVVGSGARGVYDALVELRGEGDHDGRTTRHVDTTTQASNWLRENVAGPDVVLIKASRGGRLERVADVLFGERDDQPDGEEPVS